MFHYPYCRIYPIPPKDLFEMFSNLGKYAESGNNVSAHLLALIGSSLGENEYNPRIEDDLKETIIRRPPLQYGYYASMTASYPSKPNSTLHTIFDLDVNLPSGRDIIGPYMSLQVLDPKDDDRPTKFTIQGNNTNYGLLHTWVNTDPVIIMNAVGRAIQYFSTTQTSKETLVGFTYPSMKGINTLLHTILDQPGNR